MDVRVSDFGIALWAENEVSSDFLHMHYKGKDIYTVEPDSESGTPQQEDKFKKGIDLKYVSILSSHHGC
jgi:hypothetical protein